MGLLWEGFSLVVWWDFRVRIRKLFGNKNYVR